MRVFKNNPNDIILFNKDKVEAIHTHLQPAWPVAFVEDLERNVRALSAAGVNVLLFDRPNNQSLEPLPRVKRVRGWAEVTSELEAVLK